MSGDAQDAERSWLSERDARDLVRLVGECAQIRGGSVPQKRHLMDGLAKLVGADYWMWNISRLTDSGALLAVSIVHNLSEAQLAFLADLNYAAPGNPVNQAINELSVSHENWSRRLVDMLDVEAHAEQIEHMRINSGFSRSIFCLRRVPNSEGLVSALGIHRQEPREFTDRELRLVHIIVSEVPWLHAQVPPEEGGPSFSSLPPRQQTVLNLLMDGQSAKQIAYNLELSVHTVREYVKAIYQRFEVGSRAELLRRFMVGDGRDKT